GSVQVGFADNGPQVVTADANGQIEAFITIPPGGGLTGVGGPYDGTTQVVHAIGSTGHQTARVSKPPAITGTPNGASITLTPSAIGYWGGVVSVSGTGFSTGITNVAIGIDDSRTIVNPPSDGNGAFTALVTVSPDNLISHQPWVVNAIDNRRVRASYVLPVN